MLSQDRLHFESGLEGTTPEWCRERAALLEIYLEKYRPGLADFASQRGKLTSLELGAGTCLLSLMLSKTGLFERMHCADISALRMRELSQPAALAVDGDKSVLSFEEFDFSYVFPYADHSCDIVLFDAALHHSRDMWTTLRECRRVLKPGGLLIAQREQFMAPLTAGPAIHRLLRTPEVRDGVSENIYSKLQYDYYLRACGFRPRFLPVSHGWFKAFSYLNGLVFSKWVVLAQPQAHAPVLD